MTPPFPLHFTRDMSDDECITLCLLRDLEPRLYQARHKSRPHAVWYLQQPASGDGPVEKWIGKFTTHTNCVRYYFISRAEACRAACEFYGWSLYEVTP